MNRGRTQDSRLLLVRAILTFGIAVTILGSPSCFWGGNSGKAESLAIGIIGDVVDLPIVVADQRGFFKANGLDVTPRKYETGLAAVDALLKGEVDLANPTEFVVVGTALGKHEISVVATLAKNETVYLIARKDRGIGDISHLKGKRIGLPRGTINEFYLGRLLDLHGLSVRDVTLVDVKPSQSVDIFLAGGIDALIGRNTFVGQIMQRLSGGAIVWPAQNNQPFYTVLTGRSDWLRQHSETVRRLLRSLDQADNYMASHPDEVRDIAWRRLQLDEASMAESLPNAQFSLSLDLSLIVAMSDEARWMIGNDLTTEKAVPDFMAYVNAGGLRAVKPEAVNISR